ncbi:MAG TPA: rRNA adenine N-6-methyltransferase family protein, partial [Verrucomicrobiales bacterium]|nr:rRNA adenine N-6-methyltransferase family protein [Verrucomicrobiales bacterium]
MLNSELQNHLKKIGVVPNKVLGQNFLLHEETSRWIVDQLDITREDVVVEVGPGMGALTEHLAGKPRRLILLEKDTR